MKDPVLLQHHLGFDNANELIQRHNEIARKNIAASGGSEVENGSAGFIVSFTSASKAVSCALSIQKEMKSSDAEALGFKIGINGGEPIERSNRLFGDTINFANNLSLIAGYGQIAVSCNVKELSQKDHFQHDNNHLLTLTPPDEIILRSLFNKLEEKWQDPEFDIPEYCQAMAMSQSQLYRKTTSLTGSSCNLLLKDFRLEKAKELMKKKRYNISQITFESGFTSPSYFTKCFKKKFGLLPMAYVDLLH
jgi:AraC-like DNA-binding protein